MDKLELINKLSINDKVQIINSLKKQNLYSIRMICKYLKINKSTYYYVINKQNKLIENGVKTECHHKYQELCKFLIEFNSTKKGRIYGYLRVFPALKSWLLLEKNITLELDLSPKQMRKIMKDHNIKGLKRSGSNNNYQVKKVKSQWNAAMDKVNNNYKNTTKSNQIWSMDTKQINTDEGWIYLFVIIDFYSNNIVTYNISTSKSYQDLIKPALEKIKTKFSLNQIKDVILHSDNAAEFHCQEIINWANKNKILLSKKKPYDIGGNVLSENWFYHLTIEWLPKGLEKYLTINESINDIEEYILFYNQERIHSKFLAPPISQVKI